MLSERGADISECGLYRFRLWRRWSDGPLATFIMLNPSTADADIDDPTIRKCKGFAGRLGMGGILVVNLFAFRATSPAYLWRARDPIGPDFDQIISAAIQRDGINIAAWGADKRANKQAERVKRIYTDNTVPLHALRLTKDGKPGHPLYIPYSADPIIYSTRRALKGETDG